MEYEMRGVFHHDREGEILYTTRIVPAVDIREAWTLSRPAFPDDFSGSFDPEGLFNVQTQEGPRAAWRMAFATPGVKGQWTVYVGPSGAHPDGY